MGLILSSKFQSMERMSIQTVRKLKYASVIVTGDTMCRGIVVLISLTSLSCPFRYVAVALPCK